jgi:hypothetical protein
MTTEVKTCVCCGARVKDKRFETCDFICRRAQNTKRTRFQQLVIEMRRDAIYDRFQEIANRKRVAMERDVYESDNYNTCEA